MNKLLEQQKIAKTVHSNEDLTKIVKLLQQLPKESVNETLQKMELPISKHMFVTANYSRLMKVKF